MTDIMAAIGLAQLKRYPQMLQRRKQIIEKYNEGLKNCNVQLLKHYGENYASSGHLYLVRLLGKRIEDRNEIISKMAELGIACNVHYKPLPMMTAYKNLGFNIADYPNAPPPTKQRQRPYACCAIGWRTKCLKNMKNYLWPT